MRILTKKKKKKEKEKRKAPGKSKEAWAFQSGKALLSELGLPRCTKPMPNGLPSNGPLASPIRIGAPR